MSNLIFEKGNFGREGVSVPAAAKPKKDIYSSIPDTFLAKKNYDFPYLSELDVIRHYVNLSRLNFSIDTNFYPLGSCTMKYNPKINEELSSMKGFVNLHPYQDQEDIQGALYIIHDLEKMLCEITGMNRFSFQPSAGAHGELTGMLMIRAYHCAKNNKKTKVIVPDSSHGTNPASAAMCGYEIVQIKSNENGLVDISELKKNIDKETAAVMLTNPNTLGLFEEEIKEIADISHAKGALLYYDGANLNALLGITNPALMGFDVMHINLHKTFATPHGGGGPGSGPVGVTKELIEFLPVPLVDKKDNQFYFNYDFPRSIGKVKAFYGNFLVLVKAYIYILSVGGLGLKEISENAVLNANYLKENLKKYFDLPYDKICMHETVFSAARQKQENDISALDIAKRLIDYGIHPPTVYFPLIVKEALMIEPTETESKETLDNFIEVMKKIYAESKTNPQLLKEAPHNTPVRRLNEVKAAMDLDLRWNPQKPFDNHR